MEKTKPFQLTILGCAHINDGQIRAHSNGIFFGVQRGIEKLIYDDQNRIPNKQGSKMIDSLLVEALAANIHLGHQKGYYDSAEHLRKIISDLEDHFVRNCEIEVIRMK